MKEVVLFSKKYGSLVLRVGLGIFFLWSGFLKIKDFGRAMEVYEVTFKVFAVQEIILIFGIIGMFIGGLILAGFHVREAAFGAGVLSLLPVLSLFFFPDASYINGIFPKLSTLGEIFLRDLVVLASCITLIGISNEGRK